MGMFLMCIQSIHFFHSLKIMDQYIRFSYHGNPEVSSQTSVKGATEVPWVGALRGLVGPVWWVLL